MPFSVAPDGTMTCRFVMPYVCVPLEGVDGGIGTCGVGTPSGPADEYIRELMGNPGKETATLVVGITARNTADSPDTHPIKESDHE